MDKIYFLCFVHIFWEILTLLADLTKPFLGCCISKIFITLYNGNLCWTLRLILPQTEMGLFILIKLNEPVLFLLIFLCWSAWGLMYRQICLFETWTVWIVDSICFMIHGSERFCEQKIYQLLKDEVYSWGNI